MNLLRRFVWPEPIPPAPPLAPKSFIVTPSSDSETPIDIKKLKCKKYIKSKIGNFSENNENLEKFSSHVVVMTLFYLYLFKKYKSGCVLMVDTRYSNIGLVIYMDDMFAELTKDNYRRISTSLVECIKRGVKVIIIPLCIVFQHGVSGTAHANVLIYRSKDNIIEHFEPHGNGFRANDKKKEIFIKHGLDEFMKEFNSQMINANLHEAKLVETHEVCPHIRGLQSIEGAVTNKKYKIGGYCAAWSMFFTELALANPVLSSNEILEVVYEKAGGLRGGQYLKDVIEGYADHISAKIDKYYSILFNQIMTTTEIQCRSDAATKTERDDMYEEFTTIVNIEVDLFINNMSITKKIEELTAQKNKTIVTLKHIDILEKMKIIEALTPVGNSFQSFGSSVHSPLHQKKQPKPKKRIIAPKIVATPIKNEPKPIKNEPIKIKNEQKKCPEGQHLNIKTNRCNKDKKVITQKNITQKNIVPKKCPEGQHLNIITNRCNKDKKKISEPAKTKTIKTCPEGQHLNILTNRCNKDKKIPEKKEQTKKKCPEGSHLNPITNRCNKDK